MNFKKCSAETGKKTLNHSELNSHKNITYFNNISSHSDTQGELEGTVYYVQNSIIPAGRYIYDDIQPDIISNRKTMIMFKPHIDSLSSTPIFITIYHNDEILFHEEMLPPDNLTKICTKVYAKIDADFSLPSHFDFILNDSEELQNSKDAVYFNKFIKEYNSIKVITYDGGHSPSFELFYNTSYTGKKVFFECTSTYGITILFNASKRNLEKGESIFLVNDKGTWYEVNDNNSTGKFLSEIQYMGNTWSVIVPYHVMYPGIKFKFSRGGKSGFIYNPVIKAPNELILNTIAIGMLTPHRKIFEFQENPEYHRQYFQQIPVSRLTVNTYDPIDLDEVMLPDGRLLTGHAPGNGGWHDGIMREQIAKSLIASGINNANYGINATGRDLSPAGKVSQFTAHTTIGMYENGLVVHGGSGGSGMVTLDDTIRNEFSHEVGHNFGLGHYPGGFDGSVDQIPTHRNSTWGWDCDKNFFLPNFRQEITHQPTYLEYDGVGEYALPFEGHSLGKDAMAGGDPMYEKYNVFTLHTPYSLYYIQKSLESKAVFNPDSKTGFSIWDRKKNKMVDYNHIIESFYFKYINIKNEIDVSAGDISKYLDEYDYIYISLYDGGWAKNIYFPISDSENNGKIIKINTSASYSVDLHMNGSSFTAIKNADLYFLSHNGSWLKMKYPDLEQYKDVDVSNGTSITSTELNNYFNISPYLFILCQDYSWTPDIHFPAANLNNNGNVIKIHVESVYDVRIHMNGTSFLAEKHINLHYISDGYTWFPDSMLYIERIPFEQGIKVITILGYYDPENQLPSYIYPALNAAFGMVYKSDEIKDNSCYLEVEYENGTKSIHTLINFRIADNEMNQFHVNVNRERFPRIARIIIRGVVAVEKSINPGSDNLTYTINGY